LDERSFDLMTPSIRTSAATVAVGKLAATKFAAPYFAAAHAPARIAVALAASLLASARPLVAQTGAPATGTFAFTRANVVPMDRERVLENHTVVVTNGRITAVGPSSSVRVPQGATVIDARGKYLMPGLAEMHAHVPPANAPPAVTDRVLTLYVVNGITTIRGMLGDASHLALRDGIARGETQGPRLITSGPSFNNNSVKSWRDGVDSVLSQKKAGYDLLKIHPGVSREAFDSIAATANRVGIPFSGHVPYDVGYERAISAKYGTIDHADGLLEAMLRDGSTLRPEQGGFFGLGLVDQIDTAKLASLATRTRNAGVWIVPTAALMENMTNGVAPASLAVMPEMAYWLPNQVKAWILNKQNLVGSGTFTPAQRERFVALRRQALAGLHKRGVKFLLGSDSPQIWNVPGFSTHRELEALVRSGFTPFEAITTGTVNIAEYLGESATSGTIAAGKLANFILLRANPLTDVRNTAGIDGVMLRGRWVPKGEIDSRLTTLRQ
jgi:imidazolonepropionase-like amidohydrolase